MADFKETTEVIKNNFNNHVLPLNKDISETSTQPVHFRKSSDKSDTLSTTSFTETEVSFFTNNSNNLQSDRQCLWNEVGKLDPDNENNKTYFTDCIKSTANKITEEQPYISYAKNADEDISVYRQLEITEYNNNSNNRKWPLFYFDENDKITSIKWMDASRFSVNTLENAKTEANDISGEKSFEINDKETCDNITSMINDNINKLNRTAADGKGDLEQKYASLDLKNISSSVLDTTEPQNASLEVQAQETNKNDEKEAETSYKDEFKKENLSNLIVSSKNDIKSTDISNGKETDEDTSAYKQQENNEYNNKTNKRKWPLFYIDENDKITNIKWIDGSRFEIDDAKTEANDVSGEKQPGTNNREIRDKVISMTNDNSNILNLVSNDMKDDFKQQFISSNKKNDHFSFLETVDVQDVCFSTLEKAAQEANKNDEKEVATITNSFKDEMKSENPSNFIVFSENNTKSGDSYSCQNQIFVKEETDVEKNKFPTDLFLENDAINDRLHGEKSRQNNNDTYDVQNKKTKMTAIEDEKLKSTMSLNSSRTNFCGETVSLGVIDRDLFSWRISDEKIESQINKKEIEKNSDKQDNNKGKIFNNYHDESIVKEGEINGRFSKKNISEQQNSIQKQTDLKLGGRQPDLGCSTNNLPMSSTEQMLHDKSTSGSSEAEKIMLSYDLRENSVSKNDLNIASKDFINKMSPKLPKLAKIKNELFDKTPSKELSASQTAEYKKNISEKSFENELKLKSLQLRKVNCNLLDKMHPKHFSTTVGYDSEKTKYEELENECRNDNNLHKYNRMIFGHCPECVPVQSKETVKEVRATRILSNGSFAHECNRRSREKSRSVKQYDALESSVDNMREDKRVTFTKNISIFSYDAEKSVLEDFHNQTGEKQKEQDYGKEMSKASEAMKGDIATGNPKDTSSKESGTLSKMEKKSTKIGDMLAKLIGEHSEIKKTASESNESLAKFKESSHYEIAKENVKDASTKISGTVKKLKKKSTKTGDTSTEIKVGYSKIKDKGSENTDSLMKVTESYFYDNMGFIADWMPTCTSEINLNNDLSTIFEDDETSFSEKSCLINAKAKILPIECSDLMSYAENKAKKWIKCAGSMTLQRLATLKKKKSTPEK